MRGRDRTRSARYPRCGPGASLGLRALWRAGRRLRASAGTRQDPEIAPLFFFTDPVRGPDPVRVLQNLPSGSGLVFRPFGRSDAPVLGARLAALARSRGVVFLVGGDEALAARLGADGLHLPERDLGRARALRLRRPRWILTGAAHSGRALRRARGLDAVFLSPVFATRSGAGRPGRAPRPLGPVRFALLLRQAKARAHALGGVGPKGALRLLAAPVRGFGAIDAFAPQTPSGAPAPDAAGPGRREG